jgi:hypothetical protein
MTFKDRLGRVGSGDGGVVPGMRQIAFDGDFTSFDALFPNAELGPTTVGITLAQIKAGLVEDGGEMRIDTQLMVDAGADPNFSPAVLYLTESAIASVNLSFVMNSSSFGDLPRAAVMFGVVHLDGEPLTEQAPANTTGSGTETGLAAVGMGFEANGFKFYQSRFRELTASNLTLPYLAGDVAVGPFGLSTRLGYRLSSSQASLDSTSTWSFQYQMGNRSHLSATHVLRPALVIQRDHPTQGDLKVNKFNLLYNVRP